MSLSSSQLPAPAGGDFILFTAPDGAVKVDVFFKDETVWLTQKALAELFGVIRSKARREELAKAFKNPKKPFRIVKFEVQKP